MSAPVREATGDYSRGRAAPRAALLLPTPLRVALLLAALGGAALLIAAEFSTLLEIRVLTVVKESRSGHEQHSFGLLVLGLAAVPMALGALRGASRPAMLALAVLGGIAAAIALIGDLPDTRSTGVIGERYDQASADPGTGFYLETLGAALLLVSGVGGLVLTAARRRSWAERALEAAEGAEPDEPPHAG